MKRREFLRNTSLAFAAAGAASVNTSALTSISPSTAKSANLRFGIISDLHHDFTFDAPQRLQAFINAMNQLKPDFILELGDFCCPVDKNKLITDKWNGFSGPKFHVIGNHEMDQHCTREQVVNFWGMPGRYYGFDRNGFHFIVLDANAPNPANPKEVYPSGIEDEQLLWLKADLASTQLPTFVFSHQGLDFSGLRNKEAVRILLENTQSRNGNGKVIAAFSGHTHKDYYNLINGIHYIQINSSTYRWWGERINNDSFGQEAEKAHPMIKYMTFYRDPLWAFVEVSDSGILEVHGRKTVWMGKSPHDLDVGDPEWEYPTATAISDRQLRFPVMSTV